MISWLRRKLFGKPAGILSNQEIWEELQHGDLEVDPLSPEQVQPASIDLRLAGEFKRYRQPDDDPTSCLIDSKDGVPENLHENIEGNNVVIKPGDFVLASTKERVCLPPELYAEVKGRSSFGRLAVEVHKTAGVIDPGWSGDITLEITNDMPYPVMLHQGQRVCQITIHRMNTPADPSYGEKYDSKYQNQRGPTPTRVDEDRENSDEAFLGVDIARGE